MRRVPLLTVNDFQLQVGINALLLAMLALGLNISVGWAGLLDLGYIAFYGFGAYGVRAALLEPARTGGVHLLGGAVDPDRDRRARRASGCSSALPSRRLIGDYLAIVTLFFGEAFVEFANNVAPSTLGGPNGIVAIDPIKAFGTQITTNQGYFYLLLILLVVTIAALHLLDTSRTGRAWRAVREDPLAAEVMTIPVNRVKLMAFSFGAVVAALAGTRVRRAADQRVPDRLRHAVPDPDLRRPDPRRRRQHRRRGPRRASCSSVTLDGFLRSPTEPGYLFYGVILLTLIVKLRPWRRLVAVLGGTVVFGFAVHAIVKADLAIAVGGRPAVERLDRRRGAATG